MTNGESKNAHRRRPVITSVRSSAARGTGTIPHDDKVNRKDDHENDNSDDGETHESYPSTLAIPRMNAFCLTAVFFGAEALQQGGGTQHRRPKTLHGGGDSEREVVVTDTRLSAMR